MAKKNFRYTFHYRRLKTESRWPRNSTARCNAL